MINLSEIKNKKDLVNFCLKQSCPQCIIRKIRTTEFCAQSSHEQIVKDIIIYNRKQKLAKLLLNDAV